MKVLTVFLLIIITLPVFSQDDLGIPAETVEPQEKYFFFGGLASIEGGFDLEFGMMFDDFLGFRILNYQGMETVYSGDPDEADLYVNQYYIGLLFDLGPKRMRGLYLNFGFCFYDGRVDEVNTGVDDTKNGFTPAAGLGYVIRFASKFRMGLEINYPFAQNTKIIPLLGKPQAFPWGIFRIKFGAVF